MSEHSESVILDVTEYDTWSKHFGGGVVAPLVKRPSVVQPDRESAEREAVRLAQAHPGHRFAVFTLVGIVQTKEVPTHITLGGKTVAATTKPVWQERDL